MPPIEFVPGQVWSIKSASPTQAKVIIGKVEAFGDKQAVHVSVIDVTPLATMQGAPSLLTMGHLPFDRGAIAASVDQLVATGVSPDPSFQEGYAQWLAAEGGIFTLSVSEAIETVLQIAGTAR